MLVYEVNSFIDKNSVVVMAFKTGDESGMTDLLSKSKVQIAIKVHSFAILSPLIHLQITILVLGFET